VAVVDWTFKQPRYFSCSASVAFAFVIELLLMGSLLVHVLMSFTIFRVTFVPLLLLVGCELAVELQPVLHLLMIRSNASSSLVSSKNILPLS
jgi:hypothetical protein